MKKAILLLNLGGPDDLNAVRPFLYNLFSDREIIRLGPSLLQPLIARMISILRTPKTKRAYELIGGRSPLLEITTRQAELLKQELPDTGVYVGMRYWHPTIEEALKQIKASGYNFVLGFSLYPQYSKATTGSTKKVFVKVAEELQLSYDFIDRWYDEPLYIEAIVEKIRMYLQNNEVLLFSAHSLPESFIREGDPYQSEIEATARLVVKRLADKGLKPEYRLSYQSRTGPVKWIGPSTEEMIKELAQKGFKRIVVVPISFISDHIETLYEIDILYRRMAESIGLKLIRIESLNTDPLFIKALAAIAKGYL